MYLLLKSQDSQFKYSIIMILIFMVCISYIWLVFCMIKICKAFMAPWSLPVINSSHLRNHKTGLQYLNIRSNCLATSKEVPEDWEKSQKGGGGGGQFHLQRLCVCGLVEPRKVMASKLLFAIKLMGESLPRNLSLLLTQSLCSHLDFSNCCQGQAEVRHHDDV